MRRLVTKFKIFSLVSLTALSLGANLALAKTVPTQLDTLLLGRDDNHEPCTLNRTWNDTRIEPYDQAYLLTCRSVTSARAQGNVVAVKIGHDKGLNRDDCGPMSRVELTGIGQARAQKCPDKATGAPRVRIVFQRGQTLYYGESSLTTIAPLEAALRTLSGTSAPITDRYAETKASFNADILPDMAVESITPSAQPTTTLSFDPAIVLQNGIDLNQRGSFYEASRTLNEGLSRLDSHDSVLTQVEFTLEAALADSNIAQFDSAKSHFDSVQTWLTAAKDDGIGVSDYLYRKQSTYLALDAINRHQWSEALGALKPRGEADKPLLDSGIVNALNQADSKGSNRDAATVVDRAHVSALLLEAQRAWALSVALWGTGAINDSRLALDGASNHVDSLTNSVSAASLVSIKARIERQYGRLNAAEGKIDAALASFDCALDQLQGSGHKGTKGCRFGARISTATASVISGPIVAETQLERAGILSRKADVDRQTVIKAYSDAIDASLSTSEMGEHSASDLEPYLDILADEAAEHPGSGAEALYFKAVQTIGQPAVARQMAQLQNIVTADPAVGAKVRDRAELQRQLVQLRYQLTSGEVLDPALRAKLEQERQDAEIKLEQVETDLRGSMRFSMIDDQLVGIEDIQHALQNGEYYLKVTQLKSHAYGIVIGRNKVFVYRIAADSSVLSQISDSVLSSIRDDTTQLPFFDVKGAYGLFALVTGPARSTLSGARSVIIDPSGPLKNLPAGVLITNPSSVKTYYNETQKTNPNDYSNIAFWAYSSDISYALSPRTLLISRSLPASKAKHAFIGFGENAPPPTVNASDAGKFVRFGNCSLRYSDWVSTVAANVPISAREANLAAQALGDTNAPVITNGAFSDTALMAQSNQGDYEQYQVIHFATHGIPESAIGCGSVPPALITTMAAPEANGDVISDGLLSFSEIAQMRFDANLVVLSACDTAAGVSGQLGRLSGQEDSSGTLDGLVRAFITARARSVLATYWNVPATPQTEELMQTFYRSGKIYSMGTSLRSAQSSLISNPNSSHPYFWGAYVLIGDGAKSMLSPVAKPLTAKMAAK